MKPPTRPISCTLEVTAACNLRCLHCYRCSAEPAPGELSTAEITSFIDYLVESQFLGLLIEGGEPFSRPDLFEILDHATRQLSVDISTNASLLDSRAARRPYQLGVSAVFVALHGPTQTSHEAVTRTPGSFAATIRGIEYLRSAGVETILYTSVIRQNILLLQDYIEFARNLGVRRVNLLGVYYVGGAKRNWAEISPTKVELRDALESLKSVEGITVAHRYYPNIHNCCTQACTVDACGNVIGCSYLREVCYYGNIWTKPLLEMWDSPAWTSLRHVRPRGECDGCQLFAACGGGCRASAFYVTGCWDAPDPLCWKVQGG